MREPFEGARYTLNTLFKAEILLGVAILALTAFYNLRFNTFLSSREQKIMLGHLLHFYSIGLVVILIYFANLRLWRCLWELQSVNSHITMFLNFWIFLNTLIFVCALCTLWSLRQCASEMVTTTETALLVGIDKYCECSLWKLRWDELQIKHQCCGVISYEDWQCAVWLADEGKMCDCAKARAPFSCCQKDNLGCSRVPAPEIQASLPILPIYAINTNGCLQIFKCYLERFINFLLGFLLTGLFLQLGIWFLVNFILSNQCCDFSQDCCNHDTIFTDGENRRYREVCNCKNCRAVRQAC